jgi:hypothetical protein
VDTTLTWEQLRTPQVSSFLVKPIHGKLKRMEGNIFKGIIYSLMVNCLQFRKEVDQNPGNAGCSATRALLCEVIAIRFLREFSARDLVRQDLDFLMSEHDEEELIQILTD